MTQILAGRLGLDHIGKTITVQQRKTTITGVLRGFEIMGNLIDETRFGDKDASMEVGRVSVRMTIVPNIDASLDARASVEVAE